MKITPLGPYAGAEVTGIDLSKPVSDEDRRTLNKALVDHVALVIRDQQYTPKGYLAAASVFGRPMPQDYSDFNLPEEPLINIVSSQHKDKKGKRILRGATWHTDHTNRECPPKCTVLYAVKLPSTGGDTGVCNMRAAYESLSDETKAKLADAKTANLHVGRATNRASPKGEELQEKREAPPVFHPVVRTHPESGAKALWFHTVKTDYVTGYTPEESRDLLMGLLETSIKPEFIYRHKWRPGDMLIWDNRQTMHQAYHDHDPAEHRMLYRLLLEGDRPF
jgi:taurine dioxygenase